MSTEDISIDTPPSDDVRVIFKGLILAKIRETTVSEPGIAVISALAPSPAVPIPPPISPCHQPVIQILTIQRAGGIVTDIQTFNPATEPVSSFRLLVDVAMPKIEVFKTAGEFNRLNDRHPKKDFRWFVNLDDLHGTPVKVDESRLSPKFEMNKAHLHTSDLSDGEVRKRRGSQPTSERFGRFAMEISARVALEGRTAELWHGTDRVFRLLPGSGIRYEIIYDARCRNNEDESDFGLIYEVITNVPSPDDRFSFPVDRPAPPPPAAAYGQSAIADVLLAASPEVYCVGGSYGGG